MIKGRNVTKACCICKKGNAPYKCPTCRIFYCSATCCKEHKSKGCEPPEKPAEILQKPESKRKYLFPTEDTVPMEKLEQLRDSDELKQCLANPYLRKMMKEIVDSDDLTKAIAEAMREPIFVEMADACLKVVEPPEENRPC